MATDKEKQIAGQCFKVGNDAMMKNNFDYAMQMYGQSAKLIKDNLLFRQALRGAEKKYYKDNKSGAGMFSKPKIMSIKGKVGKMKGQKNWDAMDEACEEGLALNPWDPYFNFELGNAAKARGLDEIAKFAYSEAVSPDGDFKNLEYLSTFANFAEDNRNYELAIGIWQTIQKHYPEDMEARQKIMKLQAEKTIHRGNFENATTTREIMSDADVQARLKNRNKTADEAEAPGESQEADMMRAIRKDPENRDLHMKLGDYYRKENRLQEAIDSYKQADIISGGNISIREQIEDVELMIMKKEYEKVADSAREKPEVVKLAQKAKEMGTQLLTREIDTFRARVKRYPQNMKIKLELAKRLMQNKIWGEAISLLQQAANDTRLETEALYLLGKSFLQDGKGLMAQRQFLKLSPKINFNDYPEIYKEVHYFLGRIFEQLKDKPNALEHYSKVIEVDYDYKDAGNRYHELQDEGDANQEFRIN